jgi:hypothetical protein
MKQHPARAVGTKGIDHAFSDGVWLLRDVTGSNRAVALMVLLPLVCVGLQSMLWSHFTLHSSYLRRVTKYVSRRHGESDVEDVL